METPAPNVVASNIAPAAAAPEMRLPPPPTELTPSELALLSKRLQLLRDNFAKDPAAAKKLVAVGESKPNDHLNPADFAAYTGIASLLLNLDETISKE